jgi:signal transduction histidine kinase
MVHNNEYIHCTDSNADFLGFFDPSIAPSLLFYAYVPIVILSLLLGFVVFRSRSDFQLKNKLFFLLTVVFSLHIINEIIQWIAVPAGIIYFGWSISILLRSLILVSALYFLYTFITKKDLSILRKFALSSVLLPIILLLPTKLNVQSFDIDWCGAVDGPLWLYLYGLQISIISLIFIWSVSKLLQFIKSKDEFELQSFYLLLSTTFFLIIFFGSEFFGDITTVYEINLIGPIGMLIFLAVISYIIVQYKAFNIKLVGAQALMITMWSLVGSLLFVEKSYVPRLIAGATFFFSLIAGFYLIRSVKREISQREELELLTQELEKANVRLKELDKQKSEFVSIASHQLRSPLTAMRGYASMLYEGSYGKLPEKAVEVARRIEESAKLMAMSVEDYLNVSRIESGNMKYNLSDFNLRDMAETICDDLRPEALKKGLILLFRSDIQGKGIVNADVGKTNQIIHNLINNSLKYTPKGSINVFVRDDSAKKRIYINITDTGIGMSKETAAKLFHKFTRADNANSVNVSGTGLGLFVALKMAEAMGGTITAESEGDNKGSTFTIELPIVM